MTSQPLTRDHMASESDEALLQQVRCGDADAFERLFLRHYSQVYRVLYNLLGSREEAEDIAQETFLALLDRPPPANGAALIAWLCRVALNRGYNLLRGQRRARQHAERLAEPPEQIDPHGEALRAEERARVRAAIAALPERQGRLLLLRYAGLSYGEIAAALDVTATSVGTLLARAERAFLAVYEREETGVKSQETED